MINYVMVGTNDLDKATAFYAALFDDMGASKAFETENCVGWGWGIGTPMFCVTKPFNKEPAAIGNGSMVALSVDTPAQVDALHAKVLVLGGTSEGDPGKRGDFIYAGYFRDLDGNKLNFICYLTNAAADD